MSRALRGGNQDEVLSEGFRLTITRKDLQTLSHLNWLNDEVRESEAPSHCCLSHRTSSHLPGLTKNSETPLTSCVSNSGGKSCIVV